MERSQQHPGIEIGVVRQHAAKRVARSTVRAVASEIPLHPSTLHTFLHGREPHPRVRGTLCEWYRRETGDGRDAEMAIDLLSRFMRPEHRDGFRRMVLDTMEDGFQESGRDVPAWVERMRAGE